MAGESLQKWLGRNRPPRVQITYDLETRGAIEKKELPLIVGILAPLYGDTPQDFKQYRDGKFVEIDVDNFDDVMAKIKPTYVIKGQQTISFKTIDDFTPDAMVANKEITWLNELLQQRQMLTDLLGRADGNDLLCDDLLKIYESADAQKKLLEALPLVEGKVTTNANGQITVNDGKADQNVVTNADTKVDGARAAVSEIAAGDTVSVTATSDGTTRTALLITVKTAAAPPVGQPTASDFKGTLKKAADGTFSVALASGGDPVPVNTAAATVTGEKKAAADLADGDPVTITGTQDSNGITAQTINVTKAAG